MTDDLLATIRDTWDSAAPSYDKDPGHGLMSEDERQHWLRIIRRLIPGDRPLRVLDVGTGTGVMAILLSEAGHNVNGIDIAPAMLKLARAHSEERGTDVRFELGEAAAPPFGTQSFDVVFSRHVLWTILDPVAAAKAWYHVLTPGGRVVVVDGIWPHRVVDHIAILAGRVLSKLTRHQSEDDHAYPADLYAKLPMVKARSLDTPREIFKQAGFRDIQTEFIERGSSHTPQDLRERLLNRWREYALTARVP